MSNGRRAVLTRRDGGVAERARRYHSPMGDDGWRICGNDLDETPPARCRALDDQHEARYAAFDLLADLAKERVMTQDAALRAYRGLEAIVAKPDLSSVDRWAADLTAPDRWAQTVPEPVQLQLFG